MTGVQTCALPIFCALASASAAAAAGLTMSAELSSHRIALGDQLVLSVAIAGSGSAAPKPPLIPDVEIYESGKSQSMSIVNGSVSSRVVHTYVLNPRKAGRFVVPPLELAGAEPTPPIVFTVDAAPGEAAPPAPAPSGQPAPPPNAPARAAPSPDAFVTAALDKTRAFEIGRAHV